jgi:hypothetical protein
MQVVNSGGISSLQKYNLELAKSCHAVWVCEDAYTEQENIHFSRHIIHYDQPLVPHMKD